MSIWTFHVIKMLLILSTHLIAYVNMSFFYLFVFSCHLQLAFRPTLCGSCICLHYWYFLSVFKQIPLHSYLNNYPCNLFPSPFCTLAIIFPYFNWVNITAFSLWLASLVCWGCRKRQLFLCKEIKLKQVFWIRLSYGEVPVHGLWSVCGVNTPSVTLLLGPLYKDNSKREIERLNHLLYIKSFNCIQKKD